MTHYRPDPIQHLTGQLSDSPLPPAISPTPRSGKFTPDGQMQPWKGNTWICHIDPQGDAHAALVEIINGLRAGPLAPCFAFLPETSLHMTVFQGISGPDAAHGDWPSGVPAGTGRDDVSAILLDRIKTLDLPATRKVGAIEIFAGHSMTMDGLGADEEGLRETRRRIRTATGMSQSGFEDYTFHISLAYQLRWLSVAEAEDLVALSQQLFARHGERLRSITLGRVEFCNFEDMGHFSTVRYL